MSVTSVKSVTEIKQSKQAYYFKTADNGIEKVEKRSNHEQLGTLTSILHFNHTKI